MDLLRQWSDKSPKADKWLLSPVYSQLNLQFGVSAEVCFTLAAVCFCLFVSSVADGYLVYCTSHH